MKENENKNLEKFTDNIMKNSELETPSSDFTAKIMTQIVETKTSEVYVYKPLISKSVFILIFICFMTFFIYFNIIGEVKSDSLTSHLDFTIFTKNYLTSLFNLSKVTIYTVVIATLMLFIQVAFLKKYFENRLYK
jgi:hypothetical protein